MTIFRLSSIAQTDLDEIWLFIAQDNIEAANKFHDYLFSKFLLLARQPEIGKMRLEIYKNIRSLSVKKYIIFYRTNKKDIEVVRILHGTRDIEKFL